ncbi:MAG: type II toxin-antitoxin system RelE/ParE family toxin [Candidatus Obscuribacter sp.]|nr:type II toxin-antitoxin system RelE/ParE family toxin [Candidatus Obscuribacter sp.]MBP6350083.1 type II toxin-antitoxin system RelE/ParE family toxin [Candidatus Obscuribacter sp.]MBP6594490.1 type II toxin-antitoxin system RelE/ParE family toxin [Candidatus Obscuribacter sp.]
MAKEDKKLVPIEAGEQEKEVIWWPTNLTTEIKIEWPVEVRKDASFQLGKVQQGLYPDNYRTMPTIGSGICEIKLQDDDKSQYRIIYIAKFEEAVYVLHVITKRLPNKHQITTKH